MFVHSITPKRRKIEYLTGVVNRLLVDIRTLKTRVAKALLINADKPDSQWYNLYLEVKSKLETKEKQLGEYNQALKAEQLLLENENE